MSDVNDALNTPLDPAVRQHLDAAMPVGGAGTHPDHARFAAGFGGGTFSAGIPATAWQALYATLGPVIGAVIVPLIKAWLDRIFPAPGAAPQPQAAAPAQAQTAPA